MTTQANLKLFRLCCSMIVQHRTEKALNYAVGYAQAGLHLSSDEAIRVQILYILNNLSHWRGDVAKQVRKDLKELSQAYGN